MPMLYLMCGISFSGKSTLAREIQRAVGAAYISLDDLNLERGLASEDAISVEEWEKTHAIAAQRVRALAERNIDIVIDDTNCFRWLRDRWKALATPNAYAVRLVHLNTPIPVIEARRAQNEKTQSRHGIRDVVFEEHVRTFENPAAEENALIFTVNDDPSSWRATHLAR